MLPLRKTHNETGSRVFQEPLPMPKLENGGIQQVLPVQVEPPESQRSCFALSFPMDD